MIVSFAAEAAKRNKTIKEPITPLEEDTSSETYTGQFLHNEDKVLITVDPDSDKVTIDMYDILTNEKYSQFVFDSYTLLLIAESSIRMFREMDSIL